MPLKIGQQVKQVMPVIAGEVEDVRYDAQAGVFSYLVSYEADGDQHQRWFSENEVEAS